MSTSSSESPRIVPFLLQLGEAIPPTPAVPYRYDRQRQVGQVLVNGTWVDANLTSASIDSPMTKRTRVASETTDDS